MRHRRANDQTDRVLDNFDHTNYRLHMPALVKLGKVHYGEIPVPVNSRTTWEFAAALGGGFAPMLEEERTNEKTRTRTLWAFPLCSL